MVLAKINGTCKVRDWVSTTVHKSLAESIFFFLNCTDVPEKRGGFLIAVWGNRAFEEKVREMALHESKETWWGS